MSFLSLPIDRASDGCNSKDFIVPNQIILTLEIISETQQSGKIQQNYNKRKKTAPSLLRLGACFTPMLGLKAGIP